MSPYYQPPSEWKSEEPAPPVAEPKPAPPRRTWFFYVGGFFLLLAGICLVLSNSLLWHPTGLPARVPPPANGSAK